MGEMEITCLISWNIKLKLFNCWLKFSWSKLIKYFRCPADKAGILAKKLLYTYWLIDWLLFYANFSNISALSWSYTYWNSRENIMFFSDFFLYCSLGVKYYLIFWKCIFFLLFSFCYFILLSQSCYFLAKLLAN